jgi:hypothetical protein
VRDALEKAALVVGTLWTICAVPVVVVDAVAVPGNSACGSGEDIQVYLVEGRTDQRRRGSKWSWVNLKLGGCAGCDSVGSDLGPSQPIRSQICLIPTWPGLTYATRVPGNVQ